MIRKFKHNLMRISREKKYCQLISMTNISAGEQILDVGVADPEYSPYDNYFEKTYPWPEYITALSVEPLKEFSNRYPKVRAVEFDGSVFPFQDKSFRLAISNAVIEHVGSFNNQVRFVNEMCRVGEKIYLTTPAREFPLEIHTNLPLIHWFPGNVSDQIYTFAGKGWASGNYMHLLTRKKLERLLRESKVESFNIYTHYLGPFPLHYTVIGTS